MKRLQTSNTREILFSVNRAPYTKSIKIRNDLDEQRIKRCSKNSARLEEYNWPT